LALLQIREKLKHLKHSWKENSMALLFISLLFELVSKEIKTDKKRFKSITSKLGIKKDVF